MLHVGNMTGTHAGRQEVGRCRTRGDHEEFVVSREGSMQARDQWPNKRTYKKESTSTRGHFEQSGCAVISVKNHQRGRRKIVSVTS